MGIDMQLVMPPPPQCYYTVPLDIAVPAAQHGQRWRGRVRRASTRTASSRLGTVPMQDGNEAAKELERCMGKLGFKGVEILTNVAGQELSDPAFAPFWKKAEELGALVVIHPNGFTEAQRFSRFYFNNIIGNPLETTIALHYLIFDGVLERHPKLKIFAVHGGGYLGGLFRPHRPRLGRALGLPRRPAAAADHLSQEDLFRYRRVHAASARRRWCDLFGVDHVIMGTDYPFDMADYDPIGHINSVEASTRRRAPPSPAATPRGCSGCEREKRRRWR